MYKNNPRNNNEAVGFNINIVECKWRISIFTSIKLSSFNINMVECKFGIKKERKNIQIKF